jgi:molybdate/tungstate transport system permease protein
VKDLLRDRSRWFFIFSSLAGGLLFLFLVIPIFSSILASAAGIPEALMDQRVTEAIYLSVLSGFLATIISLILGVPLAYIFSRYRFSGKVILDSLVDLPILIPHNAAGIALLFLFGPRSSFGGVFNNLGIRFVDTISGIVLAMSFVSAPFMVRSAQDAFDSISRDMEDAARNLGAPPLRVFLDISLPLAGRVIISGCMLTWARAVSEFGAVMVLAYYPKTAPVLLFDVLVGEGLESALPITGLLLIIGILVLIAFRSVREHF